MVITFDTHGNAKQKLAVQYWCDKDTLEIVYGGGKGGGKSTLGCELIFGDAMMYPGTFYFIARANRTDLVRFTKPSIAEVYDLWGLDMESYAHWNEKESCYNLYNGSKVFLLDCSYRPQDPLFARFGSMQMTRGWIEEGGDRIELMAKTNLQASIGRWKNDVYGLKAKLLITCNPCKNWVYTLYYKPFKDGKLPRHRKFIQALPQDNKMLPSDYVSNLLLTLTQSEIERLIYGNWDFDDDPCALVTWDAIVDAFTAEHAKTIKEGPESCLASDLARQGRDLWTVWHGKHNHFKLLQYEDYAKMNDIEKSMRTWERELHVPRSKVTADSDGLGQYLQDYMQGITPFINGARAAHPEKYANMKTECAYVLAGLINERKCFIDVPMEIQDAVMQQLAAILKVESVNTDTQPRRLISKDKVKEVLQASPDLAEPLLYLQTWRVKKPASGLRTGAKTGSTRSYKAKTTPELNRRER